MVVVRRNSIRGRRGGLPAACRAGDTATCLVYAENLMFGRVMVSQGSQDEAEAALRTACGAGIGEGCDALGDLLQQLERRIDAVEVWMHTCREHPPLSCARLGDVLGTLERTDEAIEVLEPACELDGLYCD